VDLRVICVVQARLGSKRFPNKVLQILFGKSIVELIFGRLKRSKTLSDIVFAIPNTPDNDALERHINKFGGFCFRGSELDVLSRYHGAAESSKANIVVRVTADCPFVDPQLLDQMLLVFNQEEADYCSNTIKATYPDGLDIEIFSMNSLDIAFADAKTIFEREHVTPFIKNSDIFKKIPIYNDNDFSNFRLTLDYKTDLKIFKKFEKIFPSEQQINVESINSLISKEPGFFANDDRKFRGDGEFMSDYEKQWAYAEDIIPGGNSFFSKRPGLFDKQHWPPYYESSKGCEVLTTDGRRLFDFGLMGVGVATLGYGNSSVDQAVKRSIDKGVSSSLNCLEEVELAERLIDLNAGWADMVRFARTGGEANLIAIRAARMVSGKSRIVFCGYHGWHDWYLSANLHADQLDAHLLPNISVAGIPTFLDQTSLPFNYNQIKELEHYFTQFDDIGVLIMEVERNVPPSPEFLKKIRELTKKNNVVLIFDECSSGFRETRGGIYLKHDIEPDIAVYGKALGNGYAITSIVGSRNVMEVLSKSFVSSTFFSERIGFSAGLATLDVMDKERSWNVISDVGDKIREIWISAAEHNNFSIEIKGLKPMPSMVMPLFSELGFRSFFVRSMLKRGFCATPTIYTCIPHQDETLLKKYELAVFDVFTELRKFGSDEAIQSYLVSAEGAIPGLKRMN
jgi:glutamate-1-semialdehyde 2,1-aminomutase